MSRLALRVSRALGLVTVQDLGRRGRMHEGVPGGGALVPELAARANRAAGNDDGAPLFEIMGALAIECDARAIVATDDGARRAIEPGERLTIASGAARVAYLAVAGGLDVPEVLGGRGALVCAGLGVVARAGDVVHACAPAHDARVVAQRPEPWRASGPVRVIPGPDLEAFAPDALAVLCGADWTISASSDRVGTRLEGPTLARAAGWVDRTAPMARGAIEVPPSGAPIVLGPEHPTTGGYPLLAVVARADLGRLLATPLGGRVRFVTFAPTDPT